MNRQLLALIVTVAIVVVLIFRMTHNYQYDKSSIRGVPYPHRCLSCGATFDYSVDELEKFVRAGKMDEQPNQVRKFPCPKCGKITAVFNQGPHENESPN